MKISRFDLKNEILYINYMSNTINILENEQPQLIPFKNYLNKLSDKINNPNDTWDVNLDENDLEFLKTLQTNTKLNSNFKFSSELQFLHLEEGVNFELDIAKEIASFKVLAERFIKGIQNEHISYLDFEDCIDHDHILMPIRSNFPLFSKHEMKEKLEFLEEVKTKMPLLVTNFIDKKTPFEEQALMVREEARQYAEVFLKQSPDYRDNFESRVNELVLDGNVKTRTDYYYTGRLRDANTFSNSFISHLHENDVKIPFGGKDFYNTAIGDSEYSSHDEKYTNISINIKKLFENVLNSKLKNTQFPPFTLQQTVQSINLNNEIIINAIEEYKNNPPEEVQDNNVPIEEERPSIVTKLKEIPSVTPNKDQYVLTSKRYNHKETLFWIKVNNSNGLKSEGNVELNVNNQTEITTPHNESMKLGDALKEAFPFGVTVNKDEVLLVSDKALSKSEVMNYLSDIANKEEANVQSVLQKKQKFQHR